MAVIVNVVADHSDVDAELERLQDRLSPDSIGRFHRDETHPYLRGRIARRFATEGDEASGKWQELTMATRAIRASLGYGAAHPINVRTGQLRSYVLSSHAVVEGGNTLAIPGRGGSAEVRRKLVAAQVGSQSRSSRRTGPNRRAPARPVLALSGADAEYIGHLFDRYLGRR